MSKSTKMKMKASYIKQTGSPDVIRYGDLPVPEIGRDQVLVKVHAVAVNHIDTYIRSGKFPTQLNFPFVLGRDMAGTVVEAGSSVTRFRAGDRVWTNNQGYAGRQGTFASYCVISENLLYFLPDSVGFREGVAAVHSALTAVIGLQFKVHLIEGETIFVNGGDGNVGNAILRIAKALGARVAVTSSDEEKRSWVVSAGADLVIDYKRDDMVQRVRQFAPAGVNVFWDATSRPDAKRAIDVIANRGRIVFIAGGQNETVLPSGQFYLRNCTLYGYTVTDATETELAEYAKKINRWFEKGILNAKIDRVLPLSEAAEAHRLVEGGRLFGKIILQP